MSRESRRTFGPVVATGVAAAALGALASAKPWAQLTGSSQRALGFAAPTLRTAGEVPLASALSLVALAAWGAVLVSRGRPRRALAALGLLDAVALLVVTVRGGLTVVGDLLDAAHADATTGGRLEAGLTGWYVLAQLVVLLSVACFVAAVRYAPAWPSMSARYDAPTGEDAPRRVEPRTNQELWKAIDEGDDLG